MYWTYGIIDPRTCQFVYVGETNNFKRRKAEHLRPPRERKTRHKPGSIKAWLKDAHHAGVTPKFVILDITETEEQSRLSELVWVEKLADAGFLLLNRWEEHRELIEAARAGEAKRFHAFWPGKWNHVVATMKPTRKRAGYEMVFPEDTKIKEGARLIILGALDDK